jgi:hypothetical protein
MSVISSAAAGKPPTVTASSFPSGTYYQGSSNPAQTGGGVALLPAGGLVGVDVATAAPGDVVFIVACCTAAGAAGSSPAIQSVSAAGAAFTRLSRLTEALIYSGYPYDTQPIPAGPREISIEVWSANFDAVTAGTVSVQYDAALMADTQGINIAWLTVSGCVNPAAALDAATPVPYAKVAQNVDQIDFTVTAQNSLTIMVCADLYDGTNGGGGLSYPSLNGGDIPVGGNPPFYQSLAWTLAAMPQGCGFAPPGAANTYAAGFFIYFAATAPTYPTQPTLPIGNFNSYYADPSASYGGPSNTLMTVGFSLTGGAPLKQIVPPIIAVSLPCTPCVQMVTKQTI